VDLKAFVTTALTDVLEGVKAAKEKYQDQVEPPQPSGGLKGTKAQRTIHTLLTLGRVSLGPAGDGQEAGHGAGDVAVQPVRPIGEDQRLLRHTLKGS
jgi:hypothetical protein